VNKLWTPRPNLRSFGSDAFKPVYQLYGGSKTDPFSKYVFEDSGTLKSWKDVASQIFFYPYGSIGIPRFNAVKLNGMGTMTLGPADANRQYFEVTNQYLGGATATVFSVIYVDGSQPSRPALWFFNDTTEIWLLPSFGLLYPVLSQGGIVRAFWLPGLVPYKWHILCCLGTLAFSVFFADGVIGSGGNPLTPVGATSVRLGASTATTPPAQNTCFVGSFAENLLYGRALSYPEIDKVTGYLAWKWGLQYLLPQSFPYKSSPPKYSIEDVWLRGGQAAGVASSLWHNY